MSSNHSQGHEHLPASSVRANTDTIWNWAEEYKRTASEPSSQPRPACPEPCAGCSAQIAKGKMLRISCQLGLKPFLAFGNFCYLTSPGVSHSCFLKRAKGTDRGRALALKSWLQDYHECGGRACLGFRLGLGLFSVHCAQVIETTQWPCGNLCCSSSYCPPTRALPMKQPP